MVSERTRQLFADRNFRLYSMASVVSWLSFFARTLALIAFLVFQARRIQAA